MGSVRPRHVLSPPASDSDTAEKVNSTRKSVGKSLRIIYYLVGSHTGRRATINVLSSITQNVPESSAHTQT